MQQCSKLYGSAAKKESTVFLRSILPLCTRRKGKGQTEVCP